MFPEVAEGLAGFEILAPVDGPQPQTHRPNATALAAAEHVRILVCPFLVDVNASRR
jgi:hypothetical protein